MDTTQAVATYDAIIIGAGISGLHQLHRLREMGMKARVYETGGDLGGTWYWNRYPGARFDSESWTYGYSFSEELLKEWDWKEHFSPQPDTLEYLNLVAKKFDLRRDIQFNSRVTTAHWNDSANEWTVTLENGATARARFLFTAIGILSTPTLPRIPGVETFRGPAYHTGRWPHTPVDFTGKRVGIIGTGASAIQAIPEIAKQAKQLTRIATAGSPPTPSPQPPNRTLHDAGRTLLGSQGGVNCITCHRWEGRPSLGIQAIDLHDSGQRLRKDWLRNYLKNPNAYRPNTLMPALWPTEQSSVPLLDARSAAQIDAVAGDIGVDAAKTGMLGTPQVVEAILSALDRHPIANLVVDPVMVSTSGAQLGTDATVQAMAKWLFPRALVVTPNLPEASALLGREIRTADDMLPAARDLLALGPRAVLLKGGHLADVATAGEDGVLQDVLVTADGAERVYAHTYIDTPHTHGTGCTLSAAIAAHLARGDTLEAAIEAALDYLLHAIGAGRHLALGRGAGPLNHGFAPRPLAAPRALEVDIDED